jgi:hypothetical protein
MSSWIPKDERQFEHIKEGLIEDGVPEQRASEIAGRTVNKRRRLEGRTPNVRTQGTGNPNKRLEERTRDELRNLAAQRHIPGRSNMTKERLIEALRAKRS